MLAAKSVFSQHSLLFARMVPPKHVKGSFGGHNQPSSVAQTRDSAVRLSSGHASSNISSASATMPLQDEGIPELGVGLTCPSSAVGCLTNPNVVPQRSNKRHPAPGSSSRAQTDAGPGDQKTSASQDRIYFLGRVLTSILRHNATSLKLQVRNDGYVVVSDLLKLDIRTRPGIPLSAYTVDDIMKAVERDNKQRFTLLTENGVLLIRANQGHSIKTIESDKLLKPILSSDEIPVCVHGTLMKNLSSILKTGLKKMGRNHVHFASGLPREDGVVSGMRYTSEVLIYLDSKKALEDGMKLYMSENGVILTEGFDGVVPPEYFAKIAKWNNGKITPLPLDANRESV